MSKEAMQMALDALKSIFASTHPYREDGTCTINDESVKLSNRAITAIENALDLEQQSAVKAVENILREYGLEAIDFVANFKSAMKDAEQPADEPVAWMYDFLDPDNREEVIPDWMTQDLADIEREKGFNVRPLYTTPQPCPEQPADEPAAWVDLLKQAEQIVRGKLLWKKFIDGTPLANDVPCWMADFAQQYICPQREWVGLTEEEREELMDNYDVASPDYAKAIEAKLKEKNT